MLLKAALLDCLSKIKEVSMEIRYSIKCLYFLLCFISIVYLPTKQGPCYLIAVITWGIEILTPFVLGA